MKLKKPLSKKASLAIKILLAILIVLAVPYLLVFLAISAYTLLGILYTATSDAQLLFAPNPPEPEIQYGEFPFEIVYSINGESFTEAGVVVCEYEGVVIRSASITTGEGKKELEWNTHIKGTEESELVIYEHQDGVVYCDVGEAFYYLGHGSENSAPEAKLYDELHDVSDYFNKARTAEEFKEKYGIEILSYKFSPPIENTFK